MALAHTRLSVTATPGPARIIHAPDGIKGTGLYTKLSVQATPGQRWITHIPDQVRGSDLFTELQVYGTPGQIHTFLPKGIIPEEVGPRIEVGAGSRFPYKRRLDIKIPKELKIAMEEEEILELLAMFLRIL